MVKVGVLGSSDIIDIQRSRVKNIGERGKNCVPLEKQKLIGGIVYTHKSEMLMNVWSEVLRVCRC